MRVLHILFTLSHHAGTPKKVYNFIEKSKHENFVFLLDPSFPSITNLSKAEVIFAKHTSHVKVIKELYEIVKLYKIDIVHTYYNNGLIYVTALKFFGLKVKLIRSFVGIELKRKLLHDFLIRIFISKVDCFTFISNYVKSFYVNKWPVIYRLPYKIIYNGAILNETVINSPKDEGTFVTISALNEYKNLFLLIETFNILVHKYKLNYILYIIGKGHLHDRLNKKIKEYNLSNNILLVGYDKEVEKYLATAHLYLHPADKEGFGIAVVEAMLSKVPVMAANAGGLPEIISDNITGFLADPYNPKEWANRIVNLLKDYLKTSEVGLNGYKHAVNNFSFEKFSNNFDHLYDEIGK